jgi:hypothetical protein
MRVCVDQGDSDCRGRIDPREERLGRPDPVRRLRLT